MTYSEKQLHDYKDNTGVIVWRACGEWLRRESYKDKIGFKLPPPCTIHPETEVKTWNGKPSGVGMITEDLLTFGDEMRDVLRIEIFEGERQPRVIWFDNARDLVYEQRNDTAA